MALRCSTYIYIYIYIYVYTYIYIYIYRERERDNTHINIHIYINIERERDIAHINIMYYYIQGQCHGPVASCWFLSPRSRRLSRGRPIGMFIMIMLCFIVMLTVSVINIVIIHIIDIIIKHKLYLCSRRLGRGRPGAGRLPAGPGKTHYMII